MEEVIATANTNVHLSVEMTRQERDEFLAWLGTAKLQVPGAPTAVDMLISLLSATESERRLPIFSS